MTNSLATPLTVGTFVLFVSQHYFMAAAIFLQAIFTYSLDSLYILTLCCDLNLWWCIFIHFYYNLLWFIVFSLGIILTYWKLWNIYEVNCYYLFVILILLIIIKIFFKPLFNHEILFFKPAVTQTSLCVVVFWWPSG